ncbi:hypothetical protein NHX12_005615 [Muraenolepis orangiensis]|uniref:Uncharacterized protein n=1 Tax=Muraenolepis orangiensis TaxID=630683 RepID=A0A9Q0DQZ6_9TELE|nr:hypothetical protein NHX12_005615 [Muraenolepis orangiensis]
MNGNTKPRRARVTLKSPYHPPQHRPELQAHDPDQAACQHCQAAQRGSGTLGTATIRRKPSTKPGVRRTLSSAGPILIRPPIVPVKTPTVPGISHLAGTGGSSGGGGGTSSVPVSVGSEECVFFAGAEKRTAPSTA